MNKRVSAIEATFEVQREEISFLKSMIEKLITPKVAEGEEDEQRNR